MRLFKKNLKWRIFNNGIFLCLNCSGKHRGLGVQVSFVISITMDSWSEKQIVYMMKGGFNKYNTALFLINKYKYFRE
jgi:hypothetical protein